MNNFKNFVASTLGGIGSTWFTLEFLIHSIFAIIIGVCVSVSSFLIIHAIQKYIFKIKKNI